MRVVAFLLITARKSENGARKCERDRERERTHEVFIFGAPLQDIKIGALFTAW